MLRGHGVTGKEIGFNNLMPISTPITLGEPKTELGKMIKDAITPPKIDLSNSPYIEKQVVTVVRLYNPKYGNNRICVCGHAYERHFDGYEDPDHQDVGCKYCCCYNFVEASSHNLELRTLVISEFAGVGACSPEIYGAKLAHIASCLGRIVDDQFRKEVSDIIRTFPCPLD